MDAPTDVDAALGDLRSSNSEKTDRAWRVVHAHFSDQIRNYAIGWRLISDDVDEAVLETWKRVFVASLTRELPHNSEQFSAYLRETCHNLLVDQECARSRHPSENLSILEQNADERVFPHLIEALTAPLGGDMAEATEAELSALRDVLLLRLSPPDIFLYGLLAAGTPIESIASKLNVMRNTADQRIFRLKNRLRGMVDAVRLYRRYTGEL